MEAEHQHEAESTEATTLDFDFTQFMLSTAADPHPQSPATTTTQTSASARQNQPYPAFQLEDPSGLPSSSSGLLQRRAAAAAVASDAKQLQNGANTFDFDALSHADIDALTAAGYLSFPMPDIANTTASITATSMSAPSSSTTSPSVPAQPFQLEIMNTTSQPASTTTVDTTTSPSRSKRRRSIDASSSSTTASKAHYPSVRPGPKPAQPSALRSFLRAQQAQANVEGTRSNSNSNSNDSWGNTTSTSARSFVTDFSARAIRSDGSYGSTTTIRSGSVGVGAGAGAGANVRGGAGLSFAGAGASMMMGAPPDAHGGCGCGCGGGVENVLPAGWVFVGLLDGRMTIPTELLARLQIPYSALSYPSTSFLRNSQSSRYHPPAPSSPLLPPPPSTARPFFQSRADTPSSSPVALFAHTTARAATLASASAQGPTSPLAGGGDVVAMDEGDEGGGGGDARADTESKLAGPGADVVNGERDSRAGAEPDETLPAAASASVEREEETEEEGMMRFYELTKREMELLLHWLRFGIVPKHVRADLDQLGLLADRYELKELIEAVRDAKDTRYMSIKERAEFDGKAVGEMQRHLGSLVLWPDPTRSKAESENNTTTNNNSGGGGNGTLAATIAGPSYQAVCAVLDDELWDLAPSTRKLVRVDFRFPLAMARQGAISPFGSDQVRELQGQPGWDSLASSSSGRQTLWNTYRDDANRQVWHRIFFDMVAKRLWTDGFVIEREMVDCISSKVFYLISR